MTRAGPTGSRRGGAAGVERVLRWHLRPRRTYQERWQRRVRGGLQTLRRAGMADAVGHGVWASHGSSQQPTSALLVLPPHDPGRMELVLGGTTEDVEPGGYDLVGG